MRKETVHSAALYTNDAHALESIQKPAQINAFQLVVTFAKVVVEGSNPFARSSHMASTGQAHSVLLAGKGGVLARGL
jgi:hypothetical protein